MLDTSYHVETPEAIDLSAQLAGPVPRALAYAIDLGIRFVVLALLMLVLAFMGLAGWGLFLIMMFVFEWFYPVFYEVLRDGQTPGKKRMNIAVVNDDLTPVTWSTSLVRNLLRAADALPNFYMLGFVSMCINKRFQRFGDMAAGSLVVHRRDVIGNMNPLPDVVAQPPPLALDIDDQVAFTGFAQRQAQLSEGRKQELAEILADMTGKSGQSGVEFVQGVGNWLLGNRQ